MWFLHMKEDTGYEEEFFAAVYEAKTEGSKGKIVSTKAKALTVEKVSENSDHIELKDLKQQIEALAMIVKGATVGNIQPKMGDGAPSPKKRKCLVILLGNLFQGTPEDLRGLELMLQDILDLDKNQ